MGRIKAIYQKTPIMVKDLEINKSGYVTPFSLMLTKKADLYLDLFAYTEPTDPKLFTVKVTKINNKEDGYEISSNYLEHLQIFEISEGLDPENMLAEINSPHINSFFKKISNMKNNLGTRKIFEKILYNKINNEINYKNLYSNSLDQLYNERRKISYKLKKDLA